MSLIELCHGDITTATAEAVVTSAGPILSEQLDDLLSWLVSGSAHA